MPRSLMIRQDGTFEECDFDSVAEIDARIGAAHLDHDYNKPLGVYAYYDYTSTGEINVFASFVMQGVYAGDVVIIGDIDSDGDRSDEFEDLPHAWFDESLAILVRKANANQRLMSALGNRRGR